MAILLTCACGKQFRAKDEFAGKAMKCRHCGLTLIIPDAVAGSPSGDAIGETPPPQAGVTTPSQVGRTPLPSERVASQPGLFHASSEAGVVSSSRLGRKASAGPDPLANTAAIPARRRRRAPRRMLWTWVAAGASLFLVFLCGGCFLLWWGHTYDEDIGTPPFKGKTTKIDAESFDVLAGGQDIWNEADQFHFYGRRVMGDFDVEVRVDKIVSTTKPIDPWIKAGLMARDNLKPDSPHISVFATPQSGYCLQRRMAKGNRSDTYPQDFAHRATQCTFPSAWVRLKRTGDEFIAYWSVDGRVWNELNKVTAKNFPLVAYVGLAATAHDRNGSVKVEFRNFSAH